MTTHVPSQNEHSVNTTSAMEESLATEPSQLSVSEPFVLPSQPEPAKEAFFYFEEEQLDLGAPFITPFQLSDARPIVQAQAQPSGQASTIPPASAVPATKTKRRPPFSLMMVALLVCVVVIVGVFVTSALAQTTPPLQTHGNRSPQMTQQAGSSPQQTMRKQPQLPVKPAPAPITAAPNGTNDWVPQQLPTGWTNAGLQVADGIQAIRAAVTFNDREMSVDNQSIGTRNNHGGTLTAAMFILTPAAKQRFVQNDVRVVNNILFDMVVNTKLVRLVVNSQPQLIKFAQQGQQQFAWVDVAFQLWQSQIDPKNPKLRIEGKELDPATHQPRIHHMIVLLLRVPPQEAGNNPAMGGVGWLVSNYALDLATGTALDSIQPA